MKPSVSKSFPLTSRYNYANRDATTIQLIGKERSIEVIGSIHLCRVSRLFSFLSFSFFIQISERILWHFLLKRAQLNVTIPDQTTGLEIQFKILHFFVRLTLVEEECKDLIFFSLQSKSYFVHCFLYEVDNRQCIPFVKRPDRLL